MTEKELYLKVYKILWKDWDPIGVNDYGGLDNEYSGYVPSVVKLLREGADINKITKLLHHHATVNMGLSTRIVESENAAEKLHKLVN